MQTAIAVESDAETELETIAHIQFPYDIRELVQCEKSYLEQLEIIFNCFFSELQKNLQELLMLE